LKRAPTFGISQFEKIEDSSSCLMIWPALIGSMYTSTCSHGETVELAGHLSYEHVGYAHTRKDGLTTVRRFLTNVTSVDTISSSTLLRTEDMAAVRQGRPSTVVSKR
jgi:hypothetical protein